MNSRPAKHLLLLVIVIVAGFFFVNFLVGSGNPLQPHRPFWLTEPEYKLVIQPKLPQYASIFGLHVSRSSFTWESGIYVRSDR